MGKKKGFTANAVVNELKGSAWFQPPNKSPAPTTEDSSTTTQSPTTTATAPKQMAQSEAIALQKQSVPVYETVERPQRSPVQQPKKSRRKRRAYDFDVTQIENMRRLRATRELQENRTVSMSELMREAVDLLLKQVGLS